MDSVGRLPAKSFSIRNTEKFKEIVKCLQQWQMVFNKFHFILLINSISIIVSQWQNQINWER